MINNILYRSLLFLACMSVYSGMQASDDHKPLLTADGPYIIHNVDGSTRVVSVSLEGQVSDTTYTALPANFSFEVVSHDGQHRFPVSLHHVERPQCYYPQPDKLFVMSDPHGDLDCAVSLLKAGGVIDNNYRWAYGRNSLMVIGDVMDRGNDATQILWLLYKLEQEAAEAGGSVHFLLGNHEPMVLMNDLRYTKEKYLLLAERMMLEYPQLLSRGSVLGYWLSTRNTIEKIGRSLFVHAGISREFLDLGLSLPMVNEHVSHGLWMNKQQRRADSPLTWFLFASKGPLWYRGMVRQEERYSPIATDTLNMVLRHFDVDRVVVGHTIFPEVTSLHGGRVLAVNVDNKKNRKHHRTRAILIEGTVVSFVDDDGKGFIP